MKIILIVLIAFLMITYMAMADDKVYTPEIVAENPFPNEEGISNFASSARSSSGEIYSSPTTQIKPFPKKKIAYELLSTALDTKSKRITQPFEFSPSGALQIGTFEEGISGDLRLSPNGLVARDLAGLTTFAIDGTSGDATFRGSVRANDFVVSDENGLISLASFLSDEITQSGGTFTTSSATMVDFTNMTLTTPSLSRDTKVQIIASMVIYGSPASGSGDYKGHSEVQVQITKPGSNTETSSSLVVHTQSLVGGEKVGGDTSYTFNEIFELPAGETTIKLQARAANDGSPNNYQTNIYAATLSFITLGR